MRKITYSLGAIATSLSYQGFSAYIIFFYVDVVKLAAPLAVAAMVIFAVWNAINDPIMGFISDRTRTPWGRRIPFIAIGAIPFGIIYFLLWVPPFDPSQMVWLFSYFLISICLFDLAYTTVALNWTSLYPEMFQSLKERAEVNSFRQAFGIMGLMLGVAVPPLLYSTIGWGWMGFLFGTIIAIVLLITLLGSYEKNEFKRDKTLGIRAAFAYTFSNKSFLIFAVANVFVQYVFILVLAAIPFFAKYVLVVDSKQTSLILFSTFAVAIVAMFAWRKGTVKFGAKFSYLLAICFLLLSLIPFFFVINFVPCVIFASLVGIGLAGIILISDILLSDIIDEDELRTGTRREGIYFGFIAFMTRLAIAMEAGSIGLILTFTGYNQQSSLQPAAFLFGIRFLIAGLPILSLIIAFIVMVFYPLARGRLGQMRKKLEALHFFKARAR